MLSKKNKLYSFGLFIDVSQAVLSHSKFAELSGLSEASRGKKYQDWTKADRAIWGNKLLEEVGHNFGVSIKYLASENSFFVRPEKENPYFVDMENKARIYQAVVAGQRFSQCLELRIYSRVIDNQFWFLTVALYWTNGDISGRNEEFVILCDFPLFAAQTEEHLKELDFEIEEHDDTHGYTDEFGDYIYHSYSAEYSKNGVSIALR